MYANNERLRIEVLTSILDTKEQAQRKILTLKENIVNWDHLPNIKLRTEERIETLEMVILRLDIRYFKTLQR